MSLQFDWKFGNLEFQEKEFWFCVVVVFNLFKGSYFAGEEEDDLIEEEREIYLRKREIYDNRRGGD